MFKCFTLITVLLHITMSTLSVHTYDVNRCFSSLRGKTVTRNIGRYNSNNKCQNSCKNQGFIIAATKGNLCSCGNVYPDVKKVNDFLCDTSCRSWSTCHSPSSCCGGRNAYSVSVVGNIDVAKRVPQKLAMKWENNRAYKTDMEGLAQKPSCGNHYDDWSYSFDHPGWSTCGHGRYMIGMYRSKQSSPDRIGLIEKVDCYDAPGYLYSSSYDRDCYHHDWYTFNYRGWSKCSNGYYMAGLYRSSGDNLYNIETALCCRPKTQAKQWGHCQRKNVWHSFNQRGWSDCPSGYYMAGLYRSSCDELYCLEEFYCCKMGNYIGPKLVVKLKDTKGTLRKCSMNAMDKSLTASTFKCINIWDSNPKVLKLNTKKFNLKDTTLFKGFKLKPITNFRPVVCSASSMKYTCKKRLSVKFSESSTLHTTFGTSLGVAVGASIEVSVSGGIIPIKVKNSFSLQITKTKSFSRATTSTKTKEITDTTDVKIHVPPNKVITINLMKSVQDLTYKWKGEFELVGWYSIEWSKSVEKFQDITTVLSGPKERINAFGTWKYPNNGVIKVMITDQNGNKKIGCEHKPGKAIQCLFRKRFSLLTSIFHFLTSWK